MQPSWCYGVEDMPTRRIPTEFDKAVGQRLRDVRIDAGLKIWEAAAKSDMGEQNWQLYERGVAKITLDKLGLFAQALGMNPHDLFERLFPAERSEVHGRASSFDLGAVARSLVGAAPELVSA